MRRAIFLGALVVCGVGAWLVLGGGEDWEAKARDDARLLARRCTPRCQVLPLQQIDEKKWRIRLRMPSGLTECFVLRADELEAERARSGVMPCSSSERGWFWGDWLVLRSYRPPRVITTLAAEAGMSRRGEWLFFRGKPEIVRRSQLKNLCEAEDAGEIQGCITPRGRIYVVRVFHRDLHGLMVVTAAHEMLHAAYRRLGERTRRKIETLMEDGSARRDPDLRRVLGLYPREQRRNELHSFLGTNYADLSGPLERHYRRYFRQRMQTVRAWHEFDSVLTSLKRKATALTEEIRRRRRALDYLKNRIHQLEVEADARKRLGDIAGYNALVDPHNAAVDEYDRQVQEYDALQPRVKALLRRIEAVRRGLDFDHAPHP